MQIIYSLVILSFTYIRICMFHNIKLLLLLTVLEKLSPLRFLSQVNYIEFSMECAHMVATVIYQL